MRNALSQPFVRFLLLLLISLRLALLFIPSFKIDMTDWQAWASRLVVTTPTSFYAPNYFADYFPGYLYILWVAGLLYGLPSHGSSFFTQSFAVYLKFIATCFDIATTMFIYRIVIKQQAKWALVAALLYLGNPAIIFNTSVWGQVDGIVAFFLVLAMYYFFENEQPYKASLIQAFSFLTKPQTIVVFPIIFLDLLRKYNLRLLLKVLVILVVSPIVISLPFFLSNPIFGLFHLFLKSANVYPYTSLFAINFWAIVGWWQSDTTIWHGLSYQIWGIILYTIALTIVAFPLVRTKQKNRRVVYLGCALAALLYFLFPTRVHERYLFPVFVYLVVAVGLYRSKLLLVSYVVLAILHLLNLWYVYYYYNVLYNNQNPPSNVFYTLTDQWYKIFAILTVGIFGLLYWYYLRTFAHARKD